MEMANSLSTILNMATRWGFHAEGQKFTSESNTSVIQNVNFQTIKYEFPHCGWGNEAEKFPGSKTYIKAGYWGFMDIYGTIA